MKAAEQALLKSGRMAVGLGNPGPSYRCTRHNVGFRVLDEMARLRDLEFEPFGRLGFFCRGMRDEREFILLKPGTFMNLSGQAVGELTDRFLVPPEAVLVISDDFHLPLGRIRIRRGGGAGGHKGLASILRTLGSDAFPRLRLGIGPLQAGESATEFVLRGFDSVDEEPLRTALGLALDAVELWIATGDIDLCMNRFNRRPRPPG